GGAARPPGRAPAERRRTRRRRGGRAGASWPSTAPTSRASSRAVPRTAASACPTRRSGSWRASCHSARRSTSSKRGQVLHCHTAKRCAGLQDLTPLGGLLHDRRLAVLRAGAQRAEADLGALAVAFDLELGVAALVL